MAILRVPFNIVFPGAGSPGANIWHLRTADNVPATIVSQANTLIGYIRTFYVACAPYIPTGTTISLGTVVEEETSTEHVPTFTPVAGSGTGSAPQALALVVTWRTSVAARRGRGRTFIGPLTPIIVATDGTPADGARTTIQTAAAALVTSSQGFANGAIGVWGYQNAYTGEGDRPPGQPRVLRDFTGSTIRDLFGILRSRRD